MAQRKQSFITRFLERFSPVLQLIGLLAVAVPTIMLINDARAFGDRIGSLEAAITRVIVIEEKLNLIIDFLKIPHKPEGAYGRSEQVF
ncbi:MAG: hypothetical protein WC100_01670 [Sterolibacterium sp.]